MPPRIITADALDGLVQIESGSVNAIITSPPYYNLRDYGMQGQIGLEDTPEEYINRLVEIFCEAKRVLRDDGTLWINIADSYAGSGKGASNYAENAKKYKQGTNKGMLGANLRTTKAHDCKTKDLIGIPWMLAFALRNSGWYLRQDIIWEKPNAMPESVTDRCTKSHEHIFLLSKSTKYYFDYKAIQEPCVGFDKTSPRGSKGTITPNVGRRKGNNKTFRGGGAYTSNQSFHNSADVKNSSVGNVENTTGLRRKRDVWRVATTGCKEAHFATFPPELIRPCVLAGSPKGGTILDMFSGSGTTGLVANQEDRHCILIDLNPGYNQIALKRTSSTNILEG